MKISGVCGRLLCCLNYEQEMYLDAKSRMPRVNRTVDTEFGPGRVVAVNVLKETVTVQLETMTKELRPDQIRPSEVQG
jgi:cell fate regulator YaaT (PSP1 superfamily)